MKKALSVLGLTVMILMISGCDTGCLRGKARSICRNHSHNAPGATLEDGFDKDADTVDTYFVPFSVKRVERAE